MHAHDTNYCVIKNGVLVVSGTGPAIRVDGNKLVIRDGPKDITPLALTRAEASRKLRHIIMTGHAGGFISFDALRLLRDTRVAFSQIDWDGSLIFASGPRGPDQPSLRRAQAVVCSGLLPNAAAGIAREILRAKLKGQAEVARLSGWTEASATIGDLAEAINHEPSGAKMLTIEARAAAVYWKQWESVPVTFTRSDPQRLDSRGRWRPGRAETWDRFGTRASILTGRNWRATTPGNSVINFLYALVRAEMTVALLAAGLDPGIGLFHLDLDNRPSLALDAMEAVRPYVDAWCLAYLASSAFANRDFHELADGEIRLTHPLAAHLGHTSAHWRRACEPVAQWLARAFGRGAAMIEPTGAFTGTGALPALPQSTGHHPERAMPALPSPLPAFLGPARGYSHRRTVARLKDGLRDDPTPRACLECGRALQRQQRRFCSSDCAKVYSRETDHLLAVSAVLSEASRARRNEKLRKSLAARRIWESENGRPSAKGHTPKIGTAENAALVNWFSTELLPRLASLRPVDIARALEISQGYSIRIKQGYMPHPRHFAVLAKLAGVRLSISAG